MDWTRNRKPSVKMILCGKEYSCITTSPLFEVGQDVIIRITAKEKKSGMMVSIDCTERYFNQIKKNCKKMLIKFCQL